jgi:peptide-methionine (R)-S-oxide reductase
MNNNTKGDMPTSDDEWKKKLSEEEYQVMRMKGTEAPFTGKYWNEHSKGRYTCAGCGQQLFASDVKFDSGTGWPSFTDAIPGSVNFHDDNSYGMHRTEVLCSKCGAHLGHMFEDGPKDKGGKRFCINSVCLALEKDESK